MHPFPSREARSLKALGKLLLVLLFVVGAAWFYGSRQPREHISRSTITLVTAPEPVFKTIRDIERQPTWWLDVRSVTRITNHKREAWEQDMGSFGKVRIEVTSEWPGERLVTTILNDQQKDWGGKWTYIIRPNASGTQVTIIEEGWVDQPLFRVMMKLSGGPHRTMDSYLRSLGAVFGETVNPIHDSRDG